MDRREFIKVCSVMAAAGLLYGCRKIPFVGKASSDESLSRAIPALKDFEDEVEKAMARGGKNLDLVKVPMPSILNASDADLQNRFGMAIDLDACNGCGKCIMACIVENNIPLVTEEEREKDRFMHWIKMRGDAPFMCAHCGDAPCEKVCPTGAANHTPDGLSAMMYKRCAGSRFCGANCPEKARKFNYNDAEELGLLRKFNAEVPVRGKGVMEKCSLCLQRLQNDRLRFKAEHPFNEWRGRNVKTACAEACPRNAIIFGNWLDPESPLVKAAKHRELFAPRSIAKFDPSVVYMRGRR